MHVLLVHDGLSWQAEFATNLIENAKREQAERRNCADPPKTRIIETDGTQESLWRRLCRLNKNRYSMRLACVECDTDEADGCKRVPEGWTDVDVAETAVGEHADWYTHLGICPACRTEAFKRGVDFVAAL